MTIEIELAARRYPVHVGPGVLDQAGDEARRLAGGRTAFVVTNATVGGLYQERLKVSLERAGYLVEAAEVPDGEEAKALDQAAALYGRLIDAGCERSDPVVALGGGVVGDVAGFVAGTYMRGVPFVQVPTTLLAQVDSSVGGKTAVDLPQGKNLVGTFWQPRVVLADVETLQTLDDRQVVAGLAEIVKTAFLSGEDALNDLERDLDQVRSKDPAALESTVAAAVRFKASVVEQDETDRGLRAILNLGHTTAHALEQRSGFEGLLHGEAVALGLVVALDLSVSCGSLSPEKARRLRALVDRLGVALPLGVEPAALVAQMYRDKKATRGKLVFVLLDDIGLPVVREVEEGDARAAVERLAAGE
jgi:3-dehydroquinate synthase